MGGVGGADNAEGEVEFAINLVVTSSVVLSQNIRKHLSKFSSKCSVIICNVCKAFVTVVVPVFFLFDHLCGGRQEKVLSSSPVKKSFFKKRDRGMPDNPSIKESKLCLD